MPHRSATRQVVSELIRALCVVALFVFALLPGCEAEAAVQVGASHAVASSIASANATGTASGWSDGRLAHATCHVCLAARPAAPAAPADPEPIQFAALPVAYPASAPAPAPTGHFRTPLSRGPPLT